MRSIHMQDAEKHNATITRAHVAEITPVVVPEVVADVHVEPLPDPMIAAINAFPGQLAAAMASMPAPVMAPRPEGSWIIDVSRDSSGQMTQLTGKFHETK